MASISNPNLDWAMRRLEQRAAEQAEFAETNKRRAERGETPIQPRFSTNPQEKGSVDGAAAYADLMGNFQKWLCSAISTSGKLPPYKAKSRARDAFLARLWREESLTQGVVFSMVERDKNRGWSLTGPYSTVRRTKDMFHNADRGAGWREHVSQLSLSYYTADIGAVLQLYRDGPVVVDGDGGDVIISAPPLAGLFSYDPTACELTGDWQVPVVYYPKRGKERKKQPLYLGTVARFCSMRDNREEYLGLGWCFLSRITELQKMLLSVWGLYGDYLGSGAPQGFLLMDGISQRQFNEIMGSYKIAVDRLTGKDEDGKETPFGVAVLANDTGRAVSAKWVPIAILPDGFSLEEFTEIVLKGYALAAGYPIDEFWSIKANSFGRGRETEVIDRRAGGKGRNAFANAHQEQLQKAGVLPARIHFEYERHDAQDRVSEASVAEAWLEVAKLAKEVGLEAEQALSWMVEEGVLPPRLTEGIEDSIATDSGPLGVGEVDSTSTGVPVTTTDTERMRLRRLRERTLDDNQARERIEAAYIAHDPDPIVRYTWTVDQADRERHRMDVLWENADEAFKRHSFPVAVAERYINQRTSDSRNVRWGSVLDQFGMGLEELVTLALDGTFSQETIEEMLELLALAAFILAALVGGDETWPEEEFELIAAARAVLEGKATRAQKRLVRDDEYRIEVFTLDAAEGIEENLRLISESGFVSNLMDGVYGTKESGHNREAVEQLRADWTDLLEIFMETFTDLGEQPEDASEAAI